jgi:hypothetical protein
MKHEFDRSSVAKGSMMLVFTAYVIGGFGYERHKELTELRAVTQKQGLTNVTTGLFQPWFLKNQECKKGTGIGTEFFAVSSTDSNTAHKYRACFTKEDTLILTKVTP